MLVLAVPMISPWYLHDFWIQTGGQQKPTSEPTKETFCPRREPRAVPRASRMARGHPFGPDIPQAGGGDRKMFHGDTIQTSGLKWILNNDY